MERCSASWKEPGDFPDQQKAKAHYVLQVLTVWWLWRTISRPYLKTTDLLMHWMRYLWRKEILQWKKKRNHWLEESIWEYSSGNQQANNMQCEMTAAKEFLQARNLLLVVLIPLLLLPLPLLYPTSVSILICSSLQFELGTEMDHGR